MLFIKDLLLWIYWNPFKLLVQKMPAPYVYLIGRAFGAVFYQVARKKRKRLERELNFVFARHVSREEGKKAVREAFRVLICNELEVLLFPVLNENNISSLVTCSGMENLDDALSNGKGAILVFAHFGANQMVMPGIGYRGYKMCQLSAPATVWKEKLPDKTFSSMEERAMKKRWDHELSLPVRHINIFGSLKEAFLCLKRKEVLGVAIDGGGGKERITVRFLGREALFSFGAIDIARRTSCAILPTFMLRDRNGCNTMIIEPPLQMDKGGNINETIKIAMQRFAQRLEEYVLRYPSHYINFLELRSIMARKGDTPLFLYNAG